MKTKKLLSVLLAAILVLVCIPAISVSAEDMAPVNITDDNVKQYMKEVVSNYNFIWYNCNLYRDMELKDCSFTGTVNGGYYSGNWRWMVDMLDVIIPNPDNSFNMFGVSDEYMNKYWKTPDNINMSDDDPNIGWREYNAGTIKGYLNDFFEITDEKPLDDYLISRGTYDDNMLIGFYLEGGFDGLPVPGSQQLENFTKTNDSWTADFTTTAFMDGASLPKIEGEGHIEIGFNGKIKSIVFDSYNFVSEDKDSDNPIGIKIASEPASWSNGFVISAIDAQKITSGDSYELAKKSLPADVKDFVLFDIKPMGFNEIGEYVVAQSPLKDVKVCIPTDGLTVTDNTVVYRIEADGSYTMLDTTIEDGYLVFYTNHFSLYAVGTKGQTNTSINSVDIPKTGGTDRIVVCSTVTLAIAISMAYIFKKKKK